MSENQAYTEGQKLPGYLKIGIVDDEVYFQEQIYGILKKCEKCLKIRMDIRIFSSAEELMESLNEKEIFTAFFLDYRLGDDNGFALAEKIQAFLPDAFLIFVSSYSEKVFDAFRMKAFRFIPKTDMEKRISEAIGSICRELESVNTAYYVAATGQGMERICFRDILYVRKEGKCSVIVTKAGERRGIQGQKKTVGGQFSANFLESAILEPTNEAGLFKRFKRGRYRWGWNNGNCRQSEKGGEEEYEEKDISYSNDKLSGFFDNQPVWGKCFCGEYFRYGILLFN